jgi:hypothetical protein
MRAEQLLGSIDVGVQDGSTLEFMLRVNGRRLAAATAAEVGGSSMVFARHTEGAAESSTAGAGRGSGGKQAERTGRERAARAMTARWHAAECCRMR